MTSLLLLWLGALLIICYWVYGATKNGSDPNEEQVALRIRTVA